MRALRALSFAALPRWTPSISAALAALRALRPDLLLLLALAVGVTAVGALRDLRATRCAGRAERGGDGGRVAVSGMRKPLLPCPHAGPRARDLALE